MRTQAEVEKQLKKQEKQMKQSLEELEYYRQPSNFMQAGGHILIVNCLRWVLKQKKAKPKLYYDNGKEV